MHPSPQVHGKRGGGACGTFFWETGAPPGTAEPHHLRCAFGAVGGQPERRRPCGPKANTPLQGEQGISPPVAHPSLSCNWGWSPGKLCDPHGLTACLTRLWPWSGIAFATPLHGGGPRHCLRGRKRNLDGNTTVCQARFGMEGPSPHAVVTFMGHMVLPRELSQTNGVHKLQAVSLVLYLHPFGWICK